MNRKDLKYGQTYLWLDTIENVMFQAEYVANNLPVIPILGSGLKVDRISKKCQVVDILSTAICKYIKVDAGSDYGRIYHKRSRV